MDRLSRAGKSDDIGGFIKSDVIGPASSTAIYTNAANVIYEPLGREQKPPDSSK